MDFIKNIFWSSEQHRLRMVWRLIGQLVVLLPILIIVQGVVGTLALGLFTAQEGLGDQLVSPQQLQAFIAQTPALMTAAALGMAPAIALSVWLAGRFLDRRPFADFGFHLDRAWWIDFAFGLALGALLMAIIFLIQWAAGWLTVTGTFVTRAEGAGFLPALAAPLLIFLAVGVYEELFSRGYQLTNLAQGFNATGMGPRAAIAIATLLSSAVFGVLHATNPNAGLFSTLNITFAGVLLAMGYLLTGELAIPIGLHITWNFFQGNVFGFPVSGTDFRSATFIAIDQGGPRVWTGGAFGPEAGLLGLAAMVLGTLLTVLWVRWRYGDADLHHRLAEAPTVDIGEEVEVAEVEA